jgi:hypothetical protein
MKQYHVLECRNQQAIAEHLHDLFTTITAGKEITQFWNPLTRAQITSYLSTPANPLVLWFKKIDLRVRDISFTVYNDQVGVGIHKDQPPVVAKVNFPVMNTKDTYNVWYNDSGKEVARVECDRPIVLRSDILHSVEIGESALFPRIQFSFCLYHEPLHLLK